jgi:hypothetical protein
MITIFRDSGPNLIHAEKILARWCCSGKFEAELSFINNELKRRRPEHGSKAYAWRSKIIIEWEPEHRFLTIWSNRQPESIDFDPFTTSIIRVHILSGGRARQMYDYRTLMSNAKL